MRKQTRNPYLKGKLQKRAEARQHWLARQLQPKVKDWLWAHKFEFCPHLGLRLALKHEWLDDATESEFLHDVWC